MLLILSTLVTIPYFKQEFKVFDKLQVRSTYFLIQTVSEAVKSVLLNTLLDMQIIIFLNIHTQTTKTCAYLS